METRAASPTIVLANPRGFCAGVSRAIDIVEELLDLYGPPIYVRKELVHNRVVVDDLNARGAVVVNEVDEVPEGAIAVLNAHGVSPEVQRLAKERGLRLVDATCPLVTKVHLEALRFVKDGLFLLLIGHEGHDEVIGTLGHAPGGIALVQDVAEAETVQPPDPERVALLTQTTLSVDETEGIVAVLRRRFPNLREPARSDICYATTNRQAAVKELAREVDVVVVVGSHNSSNSLRLRDAAADAGKAAYLVDDPADVQAAWFAGAPAVGVTAGASSPEALVERVIAAIERHTGGPVARAEIGSPEPEIVFAPPKALLELRALRGTA